MPDPIALIVRRVSVFSRGLSLPHTSLDLALIGSVKNQELEHESSQSIEEPGYALNFPRFTPIWTISSCHIITPFLSRGGESIHTIGSDGSLSARGMPGAGRFNSA